MDDRRSEEDLDAWEEPKEEVVAPETGVASSVHSGGGGGCNIKPTYSLDSSPSGPSAKKSRRSVQKRVVTIPVGETEGFRQKNGAGGEVFPPTDSWAWRKYGQKPIKGSPYPRGYYRCSSCKGCPARKQVERSRLDPTTLVVTYSFDHNHPWPLPKNARHHTPPVPPHEDEAAAPPPSSQSSPSDSPAEQEEKYPHVIGEQEPAQMIDDGEFRWFANVASPSSTSAGSDDLLYGSVLFGGSSAVGGYIPEEREVTAAVAAVAAAAGEGEAGEDDSLFAGLEELPEYSVVLRRGSAAASWFGTTG